MTNIEIIDRLCAVVEAQSAIIRKQAFFIGEQLAVNEEIKKEFAMQCDAVDDEIDALEFSMRPIHNTALRKGEVYE